MVFCSNCGEKNSNEAKFCSKCGNSIKLYKSKNHTKNDSINYFQKLFNGRIGAGDYWLGFFTLFLTIFASLIFFPESTFIENVVIILFLVFSWSLTIRRLHDLDKHWLSALLFLVPIINLLIGLEVSFSSGEKKTNNYGKPILEKESFIERLKRIFCIS